MRVRLESVGCRLNIGELEALARAVAARGHRVVAAGEAADLVVLNTCTVTAVASRKSRQLVRRMREADPKAAIAVTGCYAEMEPGAVRALGVDLVIANRDKDRIAEVLEASGLLDRSEALPEPDDSPLPSPGGPGRTRAFVKVQDGCDNRCSFCIVTVARGAGRSRPADEVAAEIRDLVTAGYREAVLTGVHLGSYGHDLGRRRGLEELVRQVLAQTRIERLRLSSLEPWDLDAAFFGLFEDARLQPHLHLPLQSGCDATLRRMARRTTRADFADLVAAARATIPDVAISTDVMAGFPGETDDEFRESFEFVARMAFSRLHVFRYSPRAGTRAAAMPGRVPGEVALDRSRSLHRLAAELEGDFHATLRGRRLPVLWEGEQPAAAGSVWSGLTGNFARVLLRTSTGQNLVNRITVPRIVGSVPGAVIASGL